jgi:TetR/AcrR family transcriptional regulator, regulator of cefoperazone and chloramphenicol sensitivity
MEVVKKQDVRTRQRLLESACQIFANKGYRDTTIADISELAGTNVAAVNYHFGDKEALYIEAWRLAFHKSLETYPPDGGISPNAPAEERFRGRIFAAMQRFAYSKNYEFEIMSKELATPTGLLVEVMRESINPLRREFDLIISELLGQRASEKQVRLCRMSIMSQCTNIMIHERHRKLFAEAGIKSDPLFENFNIEMMADHVTRFSLAGLEEIRRQIEAGELIDQDSPAAAADSSKNSETRY